MKEERKHPHRHSCGKMHGFRCGCSGFSFRQVSGYIRMISEYFRMAAADISGQSADLSGILREKRDGGIMAACY